jgi:hypothetical protein
MSHSLCVIGMYDEVKMTVPMVVRYVHSDKKEKRNTMTTEKSLRRSSQRDLASRLTSLPKGWVYKTEEVSAEVKAEVTDPSKYLMPDAPLTHSQLKSVCQLDDPHRQHRRASSITEALPSSLSASVTSMAVKRRHTISTLTSTPQTPL